MNSALSDPSLTSGVLGKRFLALLVDALLIGVLFLFAGVFIAVFGLLTLSLGWGLYGLTPLIPFCYHFLTLAQFGATPGQRVMGLCVRRLEDLGPPTYPQAFLSTLCFYLTLATGGILMLIALVTEANRTLHDMAAGLIVIHAEALTRAPAGFEIPR